jgi:hypothetical protein
MTVNPDELLPAPEGVKLFPKNGRGKPPAVHTFIRWCRKGLKASDGTIVKLEHVKIGGNLYTTREAVSRFISRLNSNTERPEPTGAGYREAAAKLDRVLGPAAA